MAGATEGWSRAFDDPIVLPDGKKLLTLKDAMSVTMAEVSELKQLVD